MESRRYEDNSAGTHCYAMLLFDRSIHNVNENHHCSYQGGFLGH